MHRVCGERLLRGDGMTGLKSPTIPAAHRPAFDAAVALMLHEPDRFPYTDVRHVERDRFNLYVGDLPTGAGKAEREAFYDSPAREIASKDLRSLVENAGVTVGAPPAPIAGAVPERVHHKSGGWRARVDGRLVYVGRTEADMLTACGIEVRTFDRMGHPITSAQAPAVVPVVESTPTAPAPPPERKVAQPGPVSVDVAPAPPVPMSAEVVDHAASTLPVKVEEWLDRLVYAPKADYARAYATHLLTGAPAPSDPGAEWAGKARARLERIVR